jgi:hypothetical protein
LIGDEAAPPDDTTSDSTQTLGVLGPMTPELAATAFLDDSTTDVAPAEASAVTTGTCSGRICYHGGDLVTDRVSVYYIWYGDWNPSPVPSLLESFAETLGNSPYYRINATYSDGSGTAINGRLVYGGSYWEGYTHTASLNNGDVGAIVRDAIDNHHLPYDPNGIYFVMGSRGVHVPGLCSQVCAWHSSESVRPPGLRGPVPALFGFIGNPLYCDDKQYYGACDAQSLGPNGTSGADGMASLLAHEIAETVTDPFGTGWYGHGDETENGDLCAWTFGTSYTVANGAMANVHLGSRDWLLQRIYNRQLRRCTRSVSG